MRRALLPVAILVCAACASETQTSSLRARSPHATEAAPGGGLFGGGGGDDGASGGGNTCTPDKGNVEIEGNGCDDDDDGKVDEVASCDSGGSGETGTDLARALGICATEEKDGYGLVSAKLTRGYGHSDVKPSRAQYNALPRFGRQVKPREGSLLTVLSTGYAQEFNGGPNVPFAQGKSWGGGAVPPGFPKGAVGCPQATDVYDVVDLKLELKAPPNAKGFRFDFNFFSSEWPVFVCSSYNDGFIAMLNSQKTNANVSFDAKNNPVSVNNGFFDRCTPNALTGCDAFREERSTCPGGPGELAGTGFGLLAPGCEATKVTRGGATGWLTSEAPIEAGETFTLDLMIWDTGDSDLDSTILLDNFRWIGAPISAPSTKRPEIR